MTILESDMAAAARNLQNDQWEVDRRFHPEKYPRAQPEPRPPGPDPEGLQKWERERLAKLDELRRRYPTLAINMLPTEMDKRQLENFTRATQEYNLAQQRAAVPEVPTTKHPRDMTPDEFKKYEAEWARLKGAKYGR